MKKGFTLLEILLVVGIIAILAGIVIVALNPTKQFAQVRNTQRKMNLAEINKALQQYYIDYSRYPASVPTYLAEICNTGTGTTTHSVNCTGLIDLSALVPTYLVAIPVDPQGSTLSLLPIAYATTNGTGYKVMKDTANKVVLWAPQTELSVKIGIGNAPLVWSSTLGTMNWSSASTTCLSLGMRLPTTAELGAALSNQFADGGSNPGGFVGYTYVVGGYWTGTDYGNAANALFDYYFGSAYYGSGHGPSWADKTALWAVRCLGYAW